MKKETTVESPEKKVEITFKPVQFDNYKVDYSKVTKLSDVISILKTLDIQFSIVRDGDAGKIQGLLDKGLLIKEQG